MHITSRPVATSVGSGCGLDDFVSQKLLATTYYNAQCALLLGGGGLGPN